MADAGQDKTALGIARARFIDGLPRKAKELKGAVTLLVGTPEADRPRDEMRRRLHALYASAQVFQEETLATALRDGIQRLDNAREQQRPLSDEDLDTLVDLAAQLPNLGSGRQGIPSVSMRPRAPSGARVPAPAVPPPAPRLQEPSPAEQQPQRVSQVPGGARPSNRPPSGRPAALHSDVISVMVVDDAEAEAQVRRALPLEQFEVIATHDPEEALRLARAAAPDVVLVGRDVVSASGADLIGRLRADPLTDFVPVILLWPADATHDPSLQGAVGADDSLRKPIDAPSLLRRIAALTAAPGRFGGGIDTLHEATVEEVADRVAREIRQGIVDSVQTGREHSISLGDGTDILAAAWSAIGRIRSHLAQRSGGRVSFRDAPRRGGPAMLALVNEGEEADAASVEQLKGRRIVVADDDPAVLWFFSGLLKEAGAIVIEAADGRVALEQTRRHRPDVVVSDILMPEVDGFALCRELKRDVSVADIPVILLSWKEDFLQRMRELQSGASGYLLKEAGGRQILARILEVLRPRLRLEEQLRAGGEIRGRIDGIGIMSLLETVAAERPDARLTIRDAWNLFELDVRKGNLVTLSRTSTDGSFARGDLALRQLLGAKSGRFTVSDSDAPVRPIFDQPLARLLTETSRKLSALLDAVSDTRLMQIHRVNFDDPTLAAMVSTSPKPTRDMLERLRSGASPRQLIIDAECAPHQMESVLDDAARRGALSQVLGANDEDLVAAALTERERDPGVLMHSNRPPASRRSLAPYENAPELPSSDLKSEPPGPYLSAELSSALAAATSAAQQRDPAADADRELDLAFERGSIAPPIIVHSAPPPVPEAALRARPLAEALAPPRADATEVDVDTSEATGGHPESDNTPVDADAPTMPEPPPEIWLPTANTDADTNPDVNPAPVEAKADDVAPSVDAALDDLFGEDKPEPATEETATAEPAPADNADEPKAEPSSDVAAETKVDAEVVAAPEPVVKPESVAEAEPAAVTETAAATPEPETPPATTLSAEAAAPAPVTEPAKQAEPAKQPAAATPAATPKAAPSKPATDAPAFWQRALFFVAIAAVGYGGFDLLQGQWKRGAPAGADHATDGLDGPDDPNNPHDNAPDDIDESSDEAQGDSDEGAATDPAASTAQPANPLATAPAVVDPAPVVPAAQPERDVGFGHVLPYIDESRGTAVPAGQGLLVVEANLEVPNARVRLGDRDLGPAPISTALAPGRHEVIFQRGDESSFRYLVIRGGETRIVQVP